MKPRGRPVDERLGVGAAGLLGGMQELEVQPDLGAHRSRLGHGRSPSYAHAASPICSRPGGWTDDSFRRLLCPRRVCAGVLPGPGGARADPARQGDLRGCGSATRRPRSRRRWARRRSRAPASNDFGRFVQYIYAGGITVTFQGEDRPSARSSTTGLGDRTPRAGSASAPPRTPSRTSPASSARPSAPRAPATPARLVSGRKTVTDFRIANGNVTSVTVGIVID